jgi:hypothetical protein
LTYSEGFDGGELLHDRFLLGEISCSYGQGRGRNHRQTDGDTHDQEDKGVMEQAVGAALGGCDLEVVEETSNPGGEDPANDQDQKRRADGVHDGLEVTLIFGSRDERSSASDEGHLRGVCDNGVCLSSFAASRVVDYISHILVNSERFSSHGRLIDGEKSVAGTVLLSDVVVFFALVLLFLTSLAFDFFLELCPAIGVVVSGDNSGIGRNNLTVLDNDLEESINFLLIVISQNNLQCHQEPVRGP